MGTVLVFTAESQSLDEFLGLERPEEPVPVGAVTLPLFEQIYAQVPGGRPDPLRVMIARYFEADTAGVASETRQLGAPQLGVTASLTVYALVALVAGTSHSGRTFVAPFSPSRVSGSVCVNWDVLRPRHRTTNVPAESRTMLVIDTTQVTHVRDRLSRETHEQTERRVKNPAVYIVAPPANERISTSVAVMSSTDVA
jgi:hypothetical protein